MRIPLRPSLRWALVISLAAVTVGALARGPGEPPARETRTLSLAVAARYPAGKAPQAVAVTEGEVWVTAAATRRLIRLDPRDGARTATVEFGAVPAGVTVLAGSVWVGFAEGSDIVKLDQADPAGERVEIGVGRTPQWLTPAEDGRGLWVAALNEPAVVRVGIGGEVEDAVDLDDGFPGAVAAGFGRVWVPDIVSNSLLVIDPDAEGPPSAVRVGSSPTSVAAGEGGVWVGNFDSQTISHFDPRLGRVVGGTRVGGPVGGITTGLGFVWVTEQENGRLLAIDPTTDEIAGFVEVGTVPQGVAVAPDGSVWVAVQGEDSVVRVTVR